MSSHEFYVANEIISEIILGLNWLINNKVIVDIAKMVLKLPDAMMKSTFVFDSSLTDPLAVDLDQDVETAAKHEVLQIH